MQLFSERHREEVRILPKSWFNIILKIVFKEVISCKLTILLKSQIALIAHSVAFSSKPSSWLRLTSQYLKYVGSTLRLWCKLTAHVGGDRNIELTLICWRWPQHYKSMSFLNSDELSVTQLVEHFQNMMGIFKMISKHPFLSFTCTSQNSFFYTRTGARAQMFTQNNILNATWVQVG